MLMCFDVDWESRAGREDEWAKMEYNLVHAVLICVVAVAVEVAVEVAVAVAVAVVVAVAVAVAVVVALLEGGFVLSGEQYNNAH